MEKKLEKKDFVLRSIERLRTDKSKGIHVVYSTFNEAFKKYYGEESKATTELLEKQGVIETRPVHGGAMLYKKGEMPERSNDKKVDRTIEAITK